MPTSVTWLPLRDTRSSILSELQSQYNVCLSKLTDQLLFKPDNTFHFQLLDIVNKFEKKNWKQNSK